MMAMAVIRWSLVLIAATGTLPGLQEPTAAVSKSFDETIEVPEGTIRFIGTACRAGVMPEINGTAIAKGNEWNDAKVRITFHKGDATVPAIISLARIYDDPGVRLYSLPGSELLNTDMRGCQFDRVTFALISGESRNELQRLAEAREAAEAAEAEQRKRQQAAAAKRAMERNRIMEQKAAEEHALIRKACSEVYAATANKKVADLTVIEEQRVRACQALNLYRPASR
ncbi:MAG TPA: hypothetical protein VN736_29415 [Candidatus Limnocylindrales bacterium]|nr:hypothetical protein [Candidatus Limnocylindrales bacterium]